MDLREHGLDYVDFQWKGVVSSRDAVATLQSSGVGFLLVTSISVGSTSGCES